MIVDQSITYDNLSDVIMFDSASYNFVTMRLAISKYKRCDILYLLIRNVMFLPHCVYVFGLRAIRTLRASVRPLKRCL